MNNDNNIYSIIEPTEVCSLAEGGCGNRNNSWCCGCLRDESGRLYQPEVCSLVEGGCGNRDSSWCCGCLRDESGRLYQPEVCSLAEGGCGNRDCLYICDCEIDKKLPTPPSYEFHDESHIMWAPLSRQTTTSVLGLSRLMTKMRGSYSNDNSNENSDEEQQDTIQSPCHTPVCPPPPCHTPVCPPPPSLKRQDTIGIRGYHFNDNNYDMYDESVPSRLMRKGFVGSPLSDDNQDKYKRDMIFKLNGKLVELCSNNVLEHLSSSDVPPNPKPGNETPPLPSVSAETESCV